MTFSDVNTDMLASIMRLKARLSDLIEPFELLDELLAMEMLSRREYNKVRTVDKTAEERNDAVLDLIVSADQCGKFLEALQRTGQQHIINFVKQKGGKCN